VEMRSTRSLLARQPARPALAQALLLSMIYRCPPSLRA
jgi:hypothetical protein